MELLHVPKYRTLLNQTKYYAKHREVIYLGALVYADIYLINASLAEIADPDERASLMKIPTTLYLTDAQIDRLLLAASRLIRNSSEFQPLMTDLQSDR